MNRWLTLGELGLIAALAVADFYDRLPYSSTPFFLLLGWISLRLRGRRWRDVGLARPANWPRALALGIVAGTAMELFSTFVTVPLLTRLAGRPPDLSDFRPLVGNLRLVLVWLVPLWLGSAAEELAHRGYLMTRVADLGRGTRAAWLASLVVVSAGFGAGHSGQGPTGMMQETLGGLMLGALYLACGRNLALPMIAHGASNTVAFVLIFFDRYPGV